MPSGSWLARYPSDVSLGVGDVATLGQVKQDQDVAERVCHDGNPADGNVEGFGHYPPTGGPDSGSCAIC